jgi:hypothetical protein
VTRPGVNALTVRSCSGTAIKGSVRPTPLEWLSLLEILEFLLKMAVEVLTQTSVGVKGHGYLPSHPAAKWKTDQVVPLTRETFLGLLEGKVPVVKVPSFVRQETCQRLVDELTPKLTPYLHATGPSVQKVGLAQFEFQAQSEEDYNTRTGKGMYRKPGSLCLLA